MTTAKAKSENQRLAVFFFMIDIPFDGYSSLQLKPLQLFPS